MRVCSFKLISIIKRKGKEKENKQKWIVSAYFKLLPIFCYVELYFITIYIFIKKFR